MENRRHRDLSHGVNPRDTAAMPKYGYVYVLRSQVDRQFYVGLTRDLPIRLRAHNDGRVDSTKKRRPLELVYWEGCRNESDAAQREKYLKTAWGKWKVWLQIVLGILGGLVAWALIHRKKDRLMVRRTRTSSISLKASRFYFV